MMNNAVGKTTEKRGREAMGEALTLLSKDGVAGTDVGEAKVNSEGATEPSCQERPISPSVAMTADEEAQKRDRSKDAERTLHHSVTDVATSVTESHTTNAIESTEERQSQKQPATAYKKEEEDLDAKSAEFRTANNVRTVCRGSAAKLVDSFLLGGEEGDIKKIPEFVRLHDTSLTFPERLMLMMTFADGKNKKESGDPVVSWTDDGRAIVIHRRKDFTKNILQLFFGHCKFESFTRKLYRWGFRREYTYSQSSNSEDEHMVFRNEHFQRAKRDLMEKMKSVTAIGRRRATKRKTVHSSTAPENESGPCEVAERSCAAARIDQPTTTEEDRLIEHQRKRMSAHLRRAQQDASCFPPSSRLSWDPRDGSNLWTNKSMVPADIGRTARASQLHTILVPTDSPQQLGLLPQAFRSAMPSTLLADQRLVSPHSGLLQIPPTSAINPSATSAITRPLLSTSSGNYGGGGLYDSLAPFSTAASSPPLLASSSGRVLRQQQQLNESLSLLNSRTEQELVDLIRYDNLLRQAQQHQAQQERTQRLVVNDLLSSSAAAGGLDPSLSLLGGGLLPSAELLLSDQLTAERAALSQESGASMVAASTRSSSAMSLSSASLLSSITSPSLIERLRENLLQQQSRGGEGGNRGQRGR